MLALFVISVVVYLVISSRDTVAREHKEWTDTQHEERRKYTDNQHHPHVRIRR
jgi:hypothetical protein